MASPLAIVAASSTPGIDPSTLTERVGSANAELAARLIAQDAPIRMTIADGSLRLSSPLDPVKRRFSR
jgi:hypothetical protein